MGVSYFIDGWYFFHDSIDPRQSSTTIKDGWIYSNRRYYQYSYDPSVVVSKELFVEPNTVYTLSVLADSYGWGAEARPMLAWQTGEQLISGGALEPDYLTVSETSAPLDIWATSWVENDPNYNVQWSWSPQVYSLYDLEGWNGIDGDPYFYDYPDFRPKKWSVTFTTPSTLAYNKMFIVLMDSRTSSVSRSLYSQFQFERGNLVTDWTTHQSEISAGSVQITTNGIDMYGGAEMNVYDGGLIHLDDGGKITTEKIWESYDMAARTELASGALDFYYKYPTTYGDDDFHLRGKINTLAMKSLSAGDDPLFPFDGPMSQGMMFEAEKEGFIFTMKNNAGNEVAAYQTVNITSASQQRNVFYGGVKVASGSLAVSGSITEGGTALSSKYAPTSHTHPWSNITGAPAQATRWPTWSEVTSKPSTFPPASHSHAYIPTGVSMVSDLNAVSTAGIYRQETPSSGYNYTTTLNLNSADGRQQLTIARNGSGMKFRGVNSGSGTSGWTAWKEVLHSDNWSSYAAAASHNHSGANITSGTVPYARLPVGTGSSQVAQGSHTHSYVPTSRTVNGKALSANITLTGYDIATTTTGTSGTLAGNGTASVSSSYDRTFAPNWYAGTNIYVSVNASTNSSSGTATRSCFKSSSSTSYSYAFRYRYQTS